jgi:glycine/D-amino acid oxidase-like deaminating enzyme
VLRPSLDPAFARWLWSFRRSCSSDRFDAGIRALLRSTAARWSCSTPIATPAWRSRCTAPAWSSRRARRAGWTSIGGTFQRLRELGYEGGSIDELDAAALAALEPAFDPTRVVAGLHARVDRFVRPEQLTAGLAERLQADGVEIRTGCELRTLARRDGAWALETSRGPVTAQQVVVAAGLPTAPLLRRLGVRVPLLGARGYSVTIAGRGTPPRHALYLAEAKLGLSPFDGGVRVAGVFELGARKEDLSPAVGDAPARRGATVPREAGSPTRTARRGVGRAAAGDPGRTAADRSAPRTGRHLPRHRARDARRHARAGDGRPARPARARAPRGARARAVRPRPATLSSTALLILPV